MTIRPEVTIGDVLTIASIIVSIGAILFSWRKHQELQRKKYADKIRRSVGTVVAKLQRWRDLSVRFFEDIQPLITEMDMTLVKEQNSVVVRDNFWLGLVRSHGISSQRIIDEQIEIAYVDLYGFNPRIQELFNEVIDRLKLIDHSILTQVLYSTQLDILQLQSEEGPYTSAQLGNKLRNTCHLLEIESNQLMNEAITPFCSQMIKLIERDDKLIVERNIDLPSVEKLYTFSREQLRERLDIVVKELLSQTSKINITSE